MSGKALVVIDIQNDITKHYRDIIGQINAAVDWAVACAAKHYSQLSKYVRR